MGRSAAQAVTGRHDPLAYYHVHICLAFPGLIALYCLRAPTIPCQRLTTIVHCNCEQNHMAGNIDRQRRRNTYITLKHRSRKSTECNTFNYNLGSDTVYRPVAPTPFDFPNKTAGDEKIFQHPILQTQKGTDFTGQKLGGDNPEKVVFHLVNNQAIFYGLVSQLVGTTIGLAPGRFVLGNLYF